MTQSILPLDSTSLPIFALPTLTVLFPGISVRLHLAPNETTSVLYQFNKLRKSTDKKLQSLVEKLSNSNKQEQQNNTSQLIIGLVPRLSQDTSTENSSFLTSDILANSPYSDLNEALHHYGIIARVVKIERMLAGRYQIVVEGLCRIRIEKFNSIVTDEFSSIQAEVSVFADNFDENNSLSPHDQDNFELLKTAALQMIELINSPTTKKSTFAGSLIVKQNMVNRIVDMVNVAKSRKSANVLTDILASIMPLDFKDKLTLLDALSLSDRIKITGELVSQRVNTIKVTDKINKSVEDNLTKQQREFILRQQLNAIKDELGEGKRDDNNPSSGSLSKDDEDDELEELKAKLTKADLGQEGRKTVQRELKRLKRMHPTQTEYQVCRNYLETLAEIPWGVFSNDNLQDNPVQRAREILDHDHYGLEKVKKRLLEYLAVLHLKQKRENSKASITNSDEPITQVMSIDKSPILLLVGPPGVGKTSLAKSVAKALGRQFYRISLGGVRDEAEIRGHRRTYVGAMPGVLVQGLRKVDTMNPVILLDEIDKVSKSNFHGDPSAALLEVLDPEQNHTFTDHYVNFPVDLSKTLFIATANNLYDIPDPLLDRMEIINLEGYTYMEKKQIASNYLLPKQMDSNGLEPGQLEVEDEALLKIITDYTREAGVRNLEREIGTLCRGKAVEYSELESENLADNYVSSVRAVDVPKYLGLESYQGDLVNDDVDLYEDKFSGKQLRRHTYGVVNGLAYMGSGNGGLLLFEATSMPGAGRIKYTGQLGAVISESAEIALSWVRANAFKLGLTKSADIDIVENKDIHLHAPQGAVPKDGPSAGVAMTVALVSLFSKKPIPRYLAMTGEMTLRGKILPVGGIKEKLLGAHMSGIKQVLLPFHTRKVVEEECEFVKQLNDFKITYVKYIWDVLAEVWPEEKYPVVLENRI